jgi:hypothetical protein
VEEFMDDFVGETHAEGKINFMKSCLDALPTNPILSRQDWENWRPRIKNICKTTKNTDLKKTGVDVISGFDQHFSVTAKY